ncbi:hypothetical protein AMECASPLE_030367 [Ameca splendens]|uniref:Uncharacterized protein n=1 Tax=Ameca splendens TaxID=208324 RepID=A0ABV0XVA6_9TELE
MVQRLCQLLGLRRHTLHFLIPGLTGWFNALIAHSLTSLPNRCSPLVVSGTVLSVLKQLDFAYNTSVHAATKHTPYYLTHGREVRVPVAMLLSSQLVNSNLPPSHADFVVSLVKRLHFVVSGRGVLRLMTSRSCIMIERFATSHMLMGGGKVT